MAHPRTCLRGSLAARRSAVPSARSCVLALLAASMLLAICSSSAIAAPDTARQRLVKRQQQLTTQLERRDRAVARLASQLDRAQAAHELALAAYTAHVVELYQAGELSRINSLVAAEDLGEAVDATILLGQLADHDARVLHAMQQTSARLEAARKRLSVARSDASQAQALLEEVEYDVRTFATPVAVASLDGAPAPLASHFFVTTPMGALGLSPLAGLAMPAAAAAQPAEMPAGLAPTGQVETGEASWYGPGFHGQNTANGERYDQYAMTAAHRTLPFGTWVKVTSGTGQAVFVRINDRGPFIDGRIIDLSYAAAQQLGISGVGDVQLQVYGPGGSPS